MDILKDRFSLRSYDPKRPLAPEVLRRILEKARWAPSAANLQPWRLVWITSGEKLAQVQRCYARPWLAQAPGILAVIGRVGQAWVRPQDSWNSLENDLAILMTYVTLAAAEEGVGSCWISNFDAAGLRRVLGLGQDEICTGITPLGYPPAGFQPGNRTRKPLEEIWEEL